eukprot:3072544-Pyramimonas_sp.AAC.1
MPMPSSQVEIGLERSVFTYGALISACEKSGQWQHALKVYPLPCFNGSTPSRYILFRAPMAAHPQGISSSVLQWQHALK